MAATTNYVDENDLLAHSCDSIEILTQQEIEDLENSISDALENCDLDLSSAIAIHHLRGELMNDAFQAEVSLCWLDAHVLLFNLS